MKTAIRHPLSKRVTVNHQMIIKVEEKFAQRDAIDLQRIEQKGKSGNNQNYICFEGRIISITVIEQWISRELCCA